MSVKRTRREIIATGAQVGVAIALAAAWREPAHGAEPTEPAALIHMDNVPNQTVSEYIAEQMAATPIEQVLSHPVSVGGLRIMRAAGVRTAGDLRRTDNLDILSVDDWMAIQDWKQHCEDKCAADYWRIFGDNPPTREVFIASRMAEVSFTSFLLVAGVTIRMLKNMNNCGIKTMQDVEQEKFLTLLPERERDFLQSYRDALREGFEAEYDGRTVIPIGRHIQQFSKQYFAGLRARTDNVT